LEGIFIIFNYECTFIIRVEVSKVRLAPCIAAQAMFRSAGGPLFI